MLIAHDLVDIVYVRQGKAAARGVKLMLESWNTRGLALVLGEPEEQALVGVSQPPYPADDSIVLQGVRGGRVAVFVVDLRSVFEVGGVTCDV